ncbi:Uncharacterized protein dnm_090950 [Desulfonema magnum]|uniref:Uncharacterized protein n=1 Tax=Desulfonema magnum TaxID=45655 RepID=A0A975BWV6_9BACT|nr:Uncharacterized protein dnm_090950 [Desulfonema magnum]
MKSGTGRFFLPRRHGDTKFHEVSVSDFFGCVKSGTGCFFATKTRSFTKSLCLIFSDV